MEPDDYLPIKKANKLQSHKKLLKTKFEEYQEMEI